jgi:hypothetical protein
MSTASGHIPSQSPPRGQRPRPVPRKGGSRSPWPKPWPHRLRFDLLPGQSRCSGCHEFWTTADPDFRALRKAQLRQAISRDFHFPRRPCLPTYRGDPIRPAWKQKLRPVALKSRADHTDRVSPSQDCVLIAYLFDSIGIFGRRMAGFEARHRSAAACMPRSKSRIGLEGVRRLCSDADRCYLFACCRCAHVASG